MKKILLSLAIIVFAGALVVGATGAFFSDSETSTGNVLAAGAIDLGIDNESYYNGNFNQGTSWDLSFDLDDQQNPYQFFNFDDLKPGDYGEDTISVHVTNNESWLCADVTLQSNDDNTCTEPENDADAEDGSCNGPGIGEGDLAQEVNFLWWADDGDNVLEDDELTLQPTGNLGQLGVGNTATVALADSDQNIWGEDGGVLTPDENDIRYIGKAWCFGNISAAPVPQDGETDVMSPAGDNEGDGNTGNGTPGQPSDGGFNCDGANVGNEAQTDSATLDISFRAVQSRNNGSFQCVNPNT